MGRFLSIDKMTDHPNQIDKSHYAAMWNNPIRYNDPDGNCPNPITGRLVVWGLRQAARAIFRPAPRPPVNWSPPSTVTTNTTATIDGTAVTQALPLLGELEIPQNTTTTNDVATESSIVNADDGKSKRSSNKLSPDKSADGDHSTFERDENGDVYKYQEWKKNDKNPNGFDGGKRFDGGKKDGSAGAPHRNKKTGDKIETPHINDKKVSGGVRPPTQKEIPNNKRFQ